MSTVLRTHALPRARAHTQRQRARTSLREGERRSAVSIRRESLSISFLSSAGAQLLPEDHLFEQQSSDATGPGRFNPAPLQT